MGSSVPTSGEQRHKPASVHNFLSQTHEGRPAMPNGLHTYSESNKTIRDIFIYFGILLYLPHMV